MSSPDREPQSNQPSSRARQLSEKCKHAVNHLAPGGHRIVVVIRTANDEKGFRIGCRLIEPPCQLKWNDAVGVRADDEQRCAYAHYAIHRVVTIAQQPSNGQIGVMMFPD